MTNNIGIRFVSDLHLEFSMTAERYNMFILPEMDDDKTDVLVLAGDIGLADRRYSYVEFIDSVAPRFRHVIYIPGNHEYYHGAIHYSFDTIKRNVAKHHNVSFVDNEVVRIDDISFVCSTMWSSFNNCDPISMFDCQQLMNDFRLIRIGPQSQPFQRKLRPIDLIPLYNQSVEFIFSAIAQESEQNQKVVVVTHHLPSTLSVPERFKNDRANGAYVSQLEDKILDSEPYLWIHGHTHDSVAYELGNTAIMCNPRGYYSHALNADFNPKMRVILD